jgi:hypothetical protein
MKQGWWNTAIIPPLKKLTQEDYKFETRLAFIVRPISKKKKKKRKSERNELLSPSIWSGPTVRTHTVKGS